MNIEKIVTNTSGVGKDHYKEIVRFQASSSVIGDSVEDSEGNRVGTIREVILDFQTSDIRYVVIDFDGIYCIGEMLFAIPVDVIQINSSHPKIIIDWNRQTLNHAPGFNKEYWPKSNHYFENVDSYWEPFMEHDTRNKKMSAG